MPDSKAGKQSYRGKVENRTRDNRRKDFTVDTFPSKKQAPVAHFP